MWSVAASGSSAMPSTSGATARRPAPPSDARERASVELRAQLVVDAPAHREQPVDGVRPRAACAPTSGSAAGSVRARLHRASVPAPAAAASAATSEAAWCLRVAAEQLVGALPRERDGHVPRGELGEREEAERREVGERLVQLPDELGEVDLRLCVRELELVVVGAEDVRRRSARPRARCRRSSVKPTENVLTGSDMLLGHQRDDQARVEPAAQHRAERHVAHQAQAHRLLEPRDQLLGAARPRDDSRSGSGTGYVQ